MDVLVERFQRRRIVSDKSSPMLYYLRQKPKTCGTVDIDVLAASIQKNCAMTKGDVKHVIEALVEEIQANLANGDKVKLNQLGTLHMTFRCPGVEKSEDCTVRNISKVNIRFVPDKELKLVNGSTAATLHSLGFHQMLFFQNTMYLLRILLLQRRNSFPLFFRQSGETVGTELPGCLLPIALLLHFLGSADRTLDCCQIE